jgi:L-ascorbate metabolism protein UlaG (beta-lactamase superfamily)
MAATAPRFTWLGHATLRVELATGETIVIDPWLDGNPSCPPSCRKLERVDLILVTHAHSDHMADAVGLARAHDALVISNYDLCGYLEAQGAPRTSGMNLGGTQEACGVGISMVRADHSSGFLRDGLPVYGGLAAGFVVQGSGWSFYFAGDTALFSDMSLVAELYRPQLAFLPIGDHFTMDPRQAALACRYLGVREVVPIHWGTFPMLRGRPAGLEYELRTLCLATRVVTLAPGFTWEWNPAG